MENKKNDVEKVDKIIPHVFEHEKKTLEERLDDVNLSETQLEEIITKETKKSGRNTLLNFIPGGKYFNELINWNDNINKKVSDLKKEELFSAYLNKSDDLEKGFSELKNFVTDPQGNILFNKILRILDDSTPDEDLINTLANALKFMTADSNFNKLFDTHRYALSQIERLTPQALMILTNYKSFPSIEEGIMEEIHKKTEKLIRNYIEQFKDINEDIEYKIEHCFKQLLNEGLIETKKVKEGYKLEVTLIGGYLLPYLT